MSAEQNISIMRRWYHEVWREGRDETIFELLAADAPLRGQNGDEEIRGPEGFLKFAKQIRNTFADTEIAVEDIFAVDDKVAVRWIATGTHSGNGLGVAPSGVRMKVSGMTIVQIMDGKIVKGWDNWDQLGMLKQVGLYQPPEPPILAKTA